MDHHSCIVIHEIQGFALDESSLTLHDSDCAKNIKKTKKNNNFQLYELSCQLIHHAYVWSILKYDLTIRFSSVEKPYNLITKS